MLYGFLRYGGFVYRQRKLAMRDRTLVILVQSYRTYRIPFATLGLQLALADYNIVRQHWLGCPWLDPGQGQCPFPA